MNAAVSKSWVSSPHSGGVKIPERTKHEVMVRLQACFTSLGYDKIARLEVRFRGALCYMDAYKEQEPDAALVKLWEEQGMQGEALQERVEAYRKYPTHLGRLRHFSRDLWSYAFYSYGQDRYEPSFLGDGWFGTPEEGLKSGCMYLEE